MLWLFVPLIQRLVARNWNFASSGLARTASSVANSVGVSTPLSAGRVLAVVMVISSWFALRPTAVAWRMTGSWRRGRR